MIEKNSHMLSDRKEKLVLCHNSESDSGTTQLIDTVYLVPQKKKFSALSTLYHLLAIDLFLSVIHPVSLSHD